MIKDLSANEEIFKSLIFLLLNICLEQKPIEYIGKTNKIDPVNVFVLRVIVLLILIQI